MYQVCWAKYQSNPPLQEDILATGNAVIQGTMSTGWEHPTLGEQNWSFWNGWIQMACRARLRLALLSSNNNKQEEDDNDEQEKKDAEKMAQWEKLLQDYQAGYGITSLPGDDDGSTS